MSEYTSIKVHFEKKNDYITAPEPVEYVPATQALHAEGLAAPAISSAVPPQYHRSRHA
jgi:hypothetical protein